MNVLVFLFADLTPASAVSGTCGLFAACSVPYFLLVGAEVWAWPRPLEAVKPVVWDVVRSDAVYPLLREWDNAKHSARQACRPSREALRDAAALAILLLTSPKGALR
ncbi:hypothetical protein G9272_32330 [Streptomyces asoensis]|uniref:Uncharacterized protein n=1 Tax=Streptomyces asoensis TaxID=249586 RepID=A0A6M4X2B1_9ACTN|nr:hypothetical protein [Streptomyces asoensis]QJT04406.1 hypothetical protein G9272_32330 [Streptomyces asoensis]